MRTDEPKDPLKGMDWKAIGSDLQKDTSAKPFVKKRLPRKIRWDWCWNAAGDLDKQESQEDGGVIWEFDK